MYHWRSFLVTSSSLIILVHFSTALFIHPSQEKVWKVVLVEEGMSFKAIAAAFCNEGIIRHQGYFELGWRNAETQRKRSGIK